jgi:phosphoadenosine phosphosulfate reductase
MKMASLSQADLVDLNHKLEERTPQELLQWASQTFGNRVASISAMQKSGTVVCHMIHASGADIPVLFVDTGVMFQETLETRDRVISEYGLNVISLHPELTMEEQTEKFGVLYLTAEGQERCCHDRKVEPLRKVAGDYDAFIGSLRRSDGGKRAVCPILSVDVETNTVRINPLAEFDDDHLAAYISEHNVIVTAARLPCCRPNPSEPVAGDISVRGRSTAESIQRTGTRPIRHPSNCRRNWSIASSAA